MDHDQPRKRIAPAILAAAFTSGVVLAAAFAADVTISARMAAVLVLAGSAVGARLAQLQAKADKAETPLPEQKEAKHAWITTTFTPTSRAE